jgi:hypothetical protein
MHVALIYFHGSGFALPVQVDKDELEDARWFHSSYLLVALGLAGGGSALRHFDPRYYPRPAVDGIRIPGRWARRFYSCCRRHCCLLLPPPAAAVTAAVCA